MGVIAVHVVNLLFLYKNPHHKSDDLMVFKPHQSQVSHSRADSPPLCSRPPDYIKMKAIFFDIVSSALQNTSTTRLVVMTLQSAPLVYSC